MRYHSNLLSIKWYLVSIFVMNLFVSLSCYAEIFKWVDANGQTHYSDKKVESGNSKVELMSVSPTLNLIPKVSVPASTSRQDSKQQELSATHSQVNNSSKSRMASESSKKRGGMEEDVDYRCSLARRVISGEAKLVNGEATGEHEIKVAKRDIRKFCN